MMSSRRISKARMTRTACGDKLDAFPKGTRVAITGGNGSRSSNTQMLVTVASLAYRKGVTIDGYFYGNGLWVDNRGRYYAFRTNVETKK